MKAGGFRRTIKGEIVFENVSFSYGAGTEPVLEDISFRCEPGKVVALLGSTGSGKTSLVNLLPRFYEYSSGSIRLDGVELKDYSRRFLRSQIGIVEQEPFLFSRSIRENITYGIQEDVPDNDIEDITRAAAIHDVITDFPKAYHTLVGEKGVTLSGGQKQRLAIARTLIKNPRILIMDDSTSSVDSETEAEIREKLVNLMKNRTTFIIAHRIQSIMDADLILVMDHGRIVQRGRHKELIREDGIYKKIYEIQIAGGIGPREGDLKMSTDFYEEEDFATRFTGKTFLRIGKQLLPHWKWALTFFFAILIVAGMDAVFTYLSKQAIDLGIVPKDVQVMVYYYTIYGILILVQAVFVFGLIYAAGMLGERIRYDLRKGMFNHLQDLSLSYFSRTPVGWIMSRVTSDSERVADLVTWGLVDSSWAVMSIITSMVFMMIINWQLALLVLLMLPMLIYVAIQFRKRILREYRDVRKNNSKITGSYNETITGVRVIKALGREKENRA